MKFKETLKSGFFKKRYKRFFADIEFKGEIITAHCPNTGSLLGLNRPGQECLFSETKEPKRKLKYTLQMVRAEKSWVGVNTSLPNKLALELFRKKPPKHWSQFNQSQSEVKINAQSRIDLVLWTSNQKSLKNTDSKKTVRKWNDKNLVPPLHFIEIKSVTLEEDGVACFPDAVTARGQKHLEELIKLVRKGFSCELLFVIQRSDCKSFKPAESIDPVYSEKLRQAEKAGVKITALPCKINEKEITLIGKALKTEL